MGAGDASLYRQIGLRLMLRRPCPTLREEALTIGVVDATCRGAHTLIVIAIHHDGRGTWLDADDENVPLDGIVKVGVDVMGSLLTEVLTPRSCLRRPYTCREIVRRADA